MRGTLEVIGPEGAIWRQIESDPIRPMPGQGETMTIRKTALGGFMCQPSKRVAFRCFRKR